MYIAKFQSPNFSFEAYGNSKDQAIDSIKKGLDIHTKQYDLDHDWWHKWQEDIYVIHVKVGQAYRDNELLK